MAIASVECTCTRCNQVFPVRRKCSNRREADRYMEWALANRVLCPDCYRAAEQQRKADIVSARLTELGIELPTIEGVSDKQIAYADSLRVKCIAADLGYLARWVGYRDSLRDHHDEIVANLAKDGYTLEEGWKLAMDEAGLSRIDLALTNISARALIDALH